MSKKKREVEVERVRGKGREGKGQESSERSPLHSSVRMRNSACPVSDSSLLMEAAEQNCTTLG